MPGSRGARARVGRRRRSRRFRRLVRATRRPRHLVYQWLLRNVRLLPVGTSALVRQGRVGRGAPAAAAARQRARVPVLRPLELRRATARAREHAREDPTGHAARQGCAHRLRCDDRRRRGAEHRTGASGRNCRGHRLWWYRAQRDPGRGDRRRGPHHRDRPHPNQVGPRAVVRRNRRGRRGIRRRGRRSARAHRRWRRLRVRSDRARGDGATSVQHVAQGRHRGRDRDDPPRRTRRDRRIPTAAREEAAGVQYGIQPLPYRHAAVRRVVPGRQAQARRVGERHDALEKINLGFEALKGGEVARQLVLFD